MGLASWLEIRVFSGNLHWDEPLVVNQSLDRTINRGNTESWQDFLAGFENILYTQRSVGRFENQFDGVALASIAIHGSHYTETHEFENLFHRETSRSAPA